MTLPRNIQDNSDYLEADFVLLDYGSSDGLEAWVKEKMGQHLLSGKLLYFRYDHARDFHRSHSRNLAFKVSPGEIVCNVDADNYTGHGFARYVNERFKKDKDIFLTTIDFFRRNRDYRVPKDVMGRICVRKDTFLQVRGFDERMVNYGFEDYDLANRLEMVGLKRVLIEGDHFFKHIPHGNEERYVLDSPSNRIRSLYICYLKPWESIILILFEDQTFSRATIIDRAIMDADDERNAYSKRQLLFKHDLKENRWHKGIWRQETSEFNLKFDDGGSITLKITDDTLIDPEGLNMFYLISNEVVIGWMTSFYIAMSNRVIMEENLYQKLVAVNDGNFGQGELVMNFGWANVS